MVRRSAVDRSPQPVAYDADYAAGTGDLAQGGGQGYRATAWRGAGGRWLIWVFRAVAWVALIVIGYRGITAIVLNETAPTPAPATTGRTGSGFPVTLASAFVLQFGQVYLNASPSTAGQRTTELARFLPPGPDPQRGWGATGSLQLQSEQVAGVSVRSPHRAVVTLLARVNGHLMELGVPVYAAGGGLAVSGDPAWLPAPARVTVPPAGPADTDLTTQAVLMKQLPAFFQAYASGDQVTLARYLAPGTVVAGLGGEVVFGSLAAVTVPAGGAVRRAVATVVWNVPGGPPGAGQAAAGQGRPATLEVSYALTIVKLSGTWYVRNIGTPAQTPGLP